jgi:ATP-dependent HslUV protease subunit HslV
VVILLPAGSGGSFAVAAARALMDVPDMDAEKIASKAMKIASDMCVYTNNNFLIEVMSLPVAGDSKEHGNAS